MATLLTDNLYYEGKQVLMLIRNDEVIFHNVHKEPPPPTPYEEQYFTFEILSAGTILWKSYSNDRTIQYSKDKGATWTSITSSSIGEEINVNAGDKVLFRGDNAQYGIGSNNYSTFSGSTAYFNAYGNIMSLIDSTGYTSLNTLAGQYNFRRFFGGTNVVDTGNLILPATTLTDCCYSGMFSNCHKLTTPPALPATTLTYQCYYYMFENDESLTTAPELPATTLARYCYEGLFQYCTSLTSAPELPASTLLERCYRLMFRGCSSLNYIKCLATDISASNCTYNWVDGVALTGTFVKSSSMTGWTTGTNGIPTGWIVYNA